MTKTEDESNIDEFARREIFTNSEKDIDQGAAFDCNGRHMMRGLRPAWDANGRWISLDNEAEPLETCPDCKGSGEYQGLGAPENCKNCNGLGQV